MSQPSWKLWVDTGGTFTDCLAVDPDGELSRLKVLSSSSLRAEVTQPLGPGRLRLRAEWLRSCTSPRSGRLLAGCRLRVLGGSDSAGEARLVGLDPGSGEVEVETGEFENSAASTWQPGTRVEIISPEEAPILAARLLTGTPTEETLPSIELRLATTRGTNALLERAGTRCALFITQGFGDLLEIGDQARGELFTLEPSRPKPLTDRAIEVPERLTADGDVMKTLDLESLDDSIDTLLEEGVESAAVALLHADIQPVHERALAEYLRRRGFGRVALSSELASTIGLLARAETATVEAYLAPVVGRYLEAVADPLPAEGSMLIMTSAGGLIGVDGFHAKDSLLSGPAGGVVGAARAGVEAGFDRLLSFDMGGTSTDVARYDGGHDVRFETRVGDARLLAPSLAIETVAAGGGSICAFTHDRLTVGPESAGADPGPACYGAGGPLTITDVNLLLGRLDPERFVIPIDVDASATALDRLLTLIRDAGQSVQASADRSTENEADALLAGCLSIADERMADAIRAISLRRGYDPADHALVAFGGAGAQHACAVAEMLDIRSIVVPADAGLLSARGLGAARIERFARRQILDSLDPSDEGVASLSGILNELDDEAIDLVRREVSSDRPITVRRRLAEVRLAGQDSALSIDARDASGLPARFHDAYRTIYGYQSPARAIEVVALTSVASDGESEALGSETAGESIEPGAVHDATPSGQRRAWVDGVWQEVSTYERRSLGGDQVVRGPALIFEAHSAVVVSTAWNARLAPSSALVLTRGEPV